MRGIVILAATLGLAQHAWAQGGRISDDPVAEARAGIERDCSLADYGEDFASRRDLDGDGREDLIISYTVTCDGMHSMFCGSAGCLTEIWYQRPDGRFALAMADNIWGAEPVLHDGRPALKISMHGMACNRVGAEGCTLLAVWTGERLEVVAQE